MTLDNEYCLYPVFILHSYGTPESLSALELPKPNISGTDTDDEDTFSDGSDGCTCRVPSPLMALEDIVDNACCAACHGNWLHVNYKLQKKAFCLQLISLLNGSPMEPAHTKGP